MGVSEFYKEFLNVGIKTLPTGENKAPMIDPATGYPLKWKNPFDSKLFELASGIGVMCGSVSDGLECLDFDNHFGNATEIFYEFCENDVVVDLMSKDLLITAQTRSGGFHLIFKSDHCEPNQKLALQLNEKTGKPEAIIETRGEGGYFCSAPTDGYKWIGLSLHAQKLGKIGLSDRRVIIELAKSFNRFIKPENASYSNSGFKVGDAYNDDPESIHDVRSLLQQNGWGVSGKYCRRPGKPDAGISATFGYVAPNVFYVFSSNAYPFEQNKGYKPFQILALLKYDGNFKECAKFLHSKYETPKQDYVAPAEKKEAPKADLHSRLMAAKVDPKKQYEKPPTILSIVEDDGEVPLFTIGDFSVLAGKQKSKKTFFTSMIAASMVYNGVFEGKLKSSLMYGKNRVAFFDTEQGEWYAQKTAKRIHYQANQSNFIEYYMLRDFDAYERRELIEYYLENNPSICLVAIDGIVDLLYDFNDQQESAKLVQWIMTITKKFNVHVVAIIHTNKADGNARGHLGTMLSQKAEVVIEIKKDEALTSQSFIKPLDIRGKEFKEFVIIIDKDGNPSFGISRRSEIF